VKDELSGELPIFAGVPAGVGSATRGRVLSPRVLTLAAIALGALLPLGLVHLSGQVYWLYIVAEFFIYAIVAISLDLLMGRTGQISLGQSGFFALGAYTAAILSLRHGTDLILAVVAGGIVSAVASLILGFPAARLRGHYLGIVTLGYGIAVDQIALKWDGLTGGDQGLHLGAAKILGFSVASPLRMYYVAFVALVLVAFLVWNITRTRLGRAFAAVKDSEIAAAASGVPVAKTKVLAFLCSAFFAGIAGGLYAFLATFIAPADFGIEQALLFFAMVVVGGMGSLPGAIAGALVVFGVQQGAATVSGLSLAILGGVIVIVALFAPRGLSELSARLIPRPRNV
jgi:branched-chain amino acid transport system permease protein